MATSGTYTYSVTAAQVIASAYEDLGIVSPGQTVPTALSTMALRRLNMIAKEWQGTADMSAGMKVWLRKRVTLFMAKGQHQYLIGPGSSDAMATLQYGRTTISANEAAGQTVLSITSNTDTVTSPGTTVTMAASDNIGIQLDDGTIQWTTISGTPTTTATVAAALTVAASAGNYVWWFTNRAQRFTNTDAVMLRDVNYHDSELGQFKAGSDYERRVASKYADGTPTSVLIEPLLTTTRVTLDSQPTDVLKTIVLTVLYPSENYDSTSDDIAFPQEYYLPLKWELQFQLHGGFGVAWTAAMDKAYTQSVGMAKQLNPENSTLYFQCNA